MLQNFVYFIPIIIFEIILSVVALIHVLRSKTYRFGNRTMWILIVIFVQIFGPLVYFLFGRENQ